MPSGIDAFLAELDLERSGPEPFNGNSGGCLAPRAGIEPATRCLEGSEDEEA